MFTPKGRSVSARIFRISPRIAYALPAAWFFALPLSPLGGAIVTGAFWITVGYLIYHGAIERRASGQPVTA